MPQIVGKEVGPIAFGMMGLTFPPKPLEENKVAMRAALSAGMNFWNAGTFYGAPTYNSITLMVDFFKENPSDISKIVLSLKGCFDMQKLKGVGDPESIKRELDDALKQLAEVGIKKIDVFECARVDPDVPIETTLKFLDDEYVKKGLVGGIALSEVSAATIKKAVKVTKIVGVENEASLWSTDFLSNGVAAACAEHDIPLLAYSPIGKGMLSGQIKTLSDLAENDPRRHYPRFQPDTFPINIQLVDEVRKLADAKGCTPAQLAINWLRCLSTKPGMPTIVPLPGSSKEERVRENATVVDLTDGEMDAIERLLAKFEIVGGRYPAGFPTDG